MTNFLNIDQLQKTCPSIFAISGSGKTSDRYGFIPTINVVQGLEKAGFYPVKAKQTGCTEHAKHLIRFRHQSYDNAKALFQADTFFPEIILVNSHDCTSSYQLRAGIYRMVCANGLVTGSDMFLRKVKHMGDVVPKVVEAATELLEVVPLSVTKIEEWKGLELKPEVKRVFAESAISLRWDTDTIPVNPDQLLLPRRIEDRKNDLWTTYNTIQEHIIKGGVKYRTPEGDRNKTRAVNSISENMRLNTALWMLTEKMAELIK